MVKFATPYINTDELKVYGDKILNRITERFGIKFNVTVVEQNSNNDIGFAGTLGSW